MRTLYETYKDRGFSVLGIPCNQFGAQEPGTEEEILAFVRDNYDVTFPMFSKVEVNGDGTCELYSYLKEAKPGDIAWNFTKFLVDGDGQVLARFEPKVTPEEIEPQVKALLGG